MCSVRIQYVRLELKRVCVAVRRMAVRFVLSAAILLAVMCSISYYFFQAVSPKPIKVALVIPKNQKEVRLAANFLSTLDSFEYISSFVYLQEKEAERLLKSGEVQAALLFKEDFYDDVDSGNNTPVKIRLSSKKQAGIEYFQELLYAGVYLIDEVEAACYALETVMGDYGTTRTVGEAQRELLQDYAADAFTLRQNMHIEVVSPTGEVEVIPYYIVVLLLVFLLLCAMQFYVLYSTESRLVDEKLRIYGAGSCFCTLCHLFFMTLVLFCLECMYFAAVNVLGKYTGFWELVYYKEKPVHLMFLAFSIACLYHGIFHFSTRQKGYRLLAAVVFLLMLVLSGCIIPLAYLPKEVSELSAWLPFTAYRTYLEQTLFGQGNAWKLLIWDIVFLGVGFFGIWQKKRLYGDGLFLVGNTYLVFLKKYQNGGFREIWLRIKLYFKWKWKQKSSVVTAICFIVLFWVCSNITMPEAGQKEIILCGVQQSEIEKNAAPLLDQSMFCFSYQEDVRSAKEAVRAGNVLAAGVKQGDDTRIYIAAYSPGVMAAKETVAALFFAERQKSLLQVQSEKIFGENASAVYARLFDSFEEIMKNGRLFGIEFQESIFSRNPGVKDTNYLSIVKENDYET